MRSTRVPGRSLGLRIPLLMVGMLAVSLGTMGWIGHHRVNRFAEEAERARLESTTHQLVATFGAQLTRLRTDLARLGATPAVRDGASPFPSAAHRRAAAAALAAHRMTSAQFLAIAIWSVDGRLLEYNGSDLLAAANAPRRPESASAVDSTVIIGPLRVRNDTVLYSATAPIIGDGRVAGYLVATRRLVSSAEGGGLYGSLIGPSARIMFANAGDTATIDLAHGSGVRVPPKGVGEYTPADGIARFYSRADLAGTPWRLLVDEPRHLVLGPSRRFALSMLVVAALFIVGAATGVWFVIRRALRPLADVTHAVVGFAEGDHSERVSEAGSEEIAQLGRAFNAMADRVASRTDDLADLLAEQQESERRYRTLIDHLPDGVMVHSDRVFVFVNPACARLFGEPNPEALVGRSILDFIDPTEHDLTLRRLGQVEEGDRVPVRELRLQRADGKRVVVESTNLPVLLDRGPAIQTILHDVTDRHVMEDRLRQAQKMEAVGRLAGGIAHDFNNIITVIDAHADFALHHSADAESRAADIEEIRRASASAARLTRQLLAFSRKQAVAPTPVNLTTTIREVMVMLRRLLGDDVVLETKLSDNLWPVFTDGNQFEQVLLNLALNARDAMPMGGSLTFTTGNVEVGPDYRSATGEMIPSGDYVVLTVEDTGVGMAPAVASRVFEPFFTTKDPGRGTGLGLSMVYGIVKQANGYIWLYTEPGRGTSFKIMLPRYEGAEGPRTSSAGSDVRDGAVRAHVLLVEDQPNVRAAVARSLRNAGVSVTDVRDAEGALRVLEGTAKIDVVITDMVMPGMSGAELAATLEVVRPALPVIIMSGYSEELTSRQWALPANARFVEKPVTAKRLIQLMNELLAAAPLG